MNVISVILDEQRREDHELKKKLNPIVDKKETMEDAKAREERAIEEATASADATFFPSPSSMSSNSPVALMSQVDGPSLLDYSRTPGIYTARSLPIALRASLEIPIVVSCGGSVVEYTVECEKNDIGFGITAEREEGVTIVTENKRIVASEESLTGKFLVGGVPCVLKFRFDNTYSWFTEKIVTYKITITPPNMKNVLAGRRRRAKIALRTVKDDLDAAEDRMTKAAESKTNLTKEIALIEKELQEKRKSLQVVEKEGEVLVDRIKIRKEQHSLLEGRLENGWDDEKELNSDVSEEAPIKTSPLKEENESENVEVSPEPESITNESSEKTVMKEGKETATESGVENQREMPQDAPTENQDESNGIDESKVEV